MAKIIEFGQLSSELERLGIQRDSRQLDCLATGSCMTWISGIVQVDGYRQHLSVPFGIDCISIAPYVSATRRFVMDLLNRYSNIALDDGRQQTAHGEANLFLAEVALIPTDYLRTTAGPVLSNSRKRINEIFGVRPMWRIPLGRYGLLESSQEIQATFGPGQRLSSLRRPDYEVVCCDVARFLVVQRP